MGRIAGLGLVILVCAALGACSEGLTLNSKDDAAGRRAYEQLRTGDIEGLMSWSGPEMKAPDSAPKIAEMRRLLPPGAPSSATATGWTYKMSAGMAQTVEMTHTYDYADRVVVAATLLQRPTTKGEWVLRGFHIKVDPKPAAPVKTAPSGSVSA